MGEIESRDCHLSPTPESVCRLHSVQKDDRAQTFPSSRTLTLPRTKA